MTAIHRPSTGAVRLGRLAAALLLLAAVAPAARAQGYRLRLDSRLQAVSFRGITMDSIPVTDTVTGPTGGPVSPDGIEAHCFQGVAYCTVFRPGPVRHTGPFVTSADLTMWGFGVHGLSLRVNTRVGTDLGSGSYWPGNDPAVQLVEGYLEYAAPRYTIRAGRQIQAGRLGLTEFDGGRAIVRDASHGLEASGYIGLGLGLGSVLPVTSPALNPLDEYRPNRRQLVAGATLGWHGAWADVGAEYQREVDRRSKYFWSERVALNADVHPLPRWSLVGGAEYNMAEGWLGSADASLRYTTRAVTALAGYRRYRPFFELWTIWGAFSPVPYNAVEGGVWVTPLPQLRLRGHAEQYWFEQSDASTPLVTVEDNGWRVSLGGTYTFSPQWSVDAGYHAEFGPGAASRGYDAAVTWNPTALLSLSAHGATLDRPLEFRYDDARVRWYGVEAEVRPQDRIRLSASADRYEENRRRPDAGGIDWNQWRLSARISLYFTSNADQLPLPPAVGRRHRSPGR